MKSPFHFSAAASLSPLLGVAMVAALLAGCGQKGPLYLGTPPPPHPVRNAPDSASGMDGAAAMSIAPQSETDAGAATQADTGGKASFGVKGSIAPDSK